MALNQFLTNQFSDAKATCCQILSDDADDPETLHLLGILIGRDGDLNGAVELVNKAVRLRSDFFLGHQTLGQLYVSLNRLPDAIASYRHAALLCPGGGANWFNLGVVLRMHGDRERAISSFEKAIVITPLHAEAHAELGALLRTSGRLRDAVAMLKRAVSLKPESAEFRSNLAAVLLDQGMFDLAEAEYRRAVSLSPQSPVFHVNLADLLVRKSQYAQSLPVYEEALRLAPDYARAYTGRAVALAGLERLSQSLADHRQAVQLTPEDASAHVAMARSLATAGEWLAAENSCRAALQLDPKSTFAWESLGLILRSLGRFEEAITCFRRSLEILPSAGAYLLLSTTACKPGSVDAGRLLSHSKVADLPPDDRVAFGFALGKILDEAGNFDQAWSQYASANALFKELSAKRGNKFVKSAFVQQIDSTVAQFDREFYRNKKPWGNQSELPVFIVGMPRSGTTLVEQIVATHSKVYGAGELPDIQLFDEALSTKTPNWDGAKWCQSDIQAMSAMYLKKIEALSGGAVRVIDKMPANILNLGLIATLFPRSRVIFCKRDPRDNCLSCFFQYFKMNTQLFSYDLVDCATQYLGQDRLYSHWQNELPLHMLTVQYEELVTDLEAQSRRLIAFLGLDWEAKCLDFHATERVVTTASAWQVRQPLYSQSVGRWKHYEKHLGPLLTALGEKPNR